MTTIHGEFEPGFEQVREAFSRNFELHGDVGAALCLYVHGRKVVDIWGGVADVENDRPWEADTLQLVMSATKGAAAATVLRLVDRGLLDLDAPVSHYWPQFGAGGKGEIPVRWILSHQAGLVAVDAELSVDDLLEGSPVVEALELQPPLWPPGTGHGYHSLTLGYLLGELVRRVDGRTIGEMFRDEVAGPLDLDFWIGLPNSEEHRVSRLVAPSAPAPTGTSDPTPEQVALAEALQDPDSLTRRALGMSAGIDFDDPHVHAAELASANGICDARSLARMYAATIGEVDGVRVLSPAMVRAAASTEAEGLDKVMFRHNRFGLGFLLKSPSLALPTEGAFGHTGSGGSLGFADPTLGIGFGYVMNQMQHPRGPDPRFNGLIDAARSALTSGGD